MYSLDKTEDDKTLKCNSTPQSPTKSPEGGLVCSTPPLVSPKKWTVKRSSGGFDSNGSLEIVKAVAKPSAKPPLLPQKSFEEQPDDKKEILDAKSLMDWWKVRTPWNSFCKDLKLRGKKEDNCSDILVLAKDVEQLTKVIPRAMLLWIIKDKAEQLYKAIQVFILLMSEHGGTLKDHTYELLSIADNLDKVSKGAKIAGITGGATTVAGGVAAAAGVILSPFTFGASLALTAVGVGVAAAGGLTGASAAIAHKVNNDQDKKKIEKTLQEYKDVMEIVQNCLMFIHEGMEELQKHDLSVLSEARVGSERVAKMVQLATGGASARAIEANSKASGLVDGFALGMDMYFTQDKVGQKLKTGLASKFAKKIRKLATELNKGLDELMQIKDLFSEN